MILRVDDTCYTHLMWLLTFRAREFSQAVYDYTCSQPDFDSEGVAGYIQCKLVFNIKNLSLFASIWEEWYIADNRSEFYAQITRSRA